MNNDPFPESPYNDTEVLATLDDPLIRRPIAEEPDPALLETLADRDGETPESAGDNGLFRRLKAGETVYVRALPADRRFSIEPVKWGGVVLAYTVRTADGRVEGGYNKIMLDDAIVRDWCAHLIEITKEDLTNGNKATDLSL